MTVIVLLGAPGAGKGTQAPALAGRLGVPVLASGELLRAAVAAGTPLGREADRYMSRGQLVPDETIVRVFLDRLSAPDAVAGAVLDGYPRTRVQAEALDAALAEAGRRVDRAAYIDVPLEDLVTRMANRRICTANGHVYNLVSNPPGIDSLCDLDGSELVQRADDEEATVRSRMAQQVPPLLDVVEHYRSRGVLTSVDGRQGIDSRHGRADGRSRAAPGRSDMVTRKSRAEIERMRRAGRIVGEVLDKIEAELRPGVSTAHLDAIAEAHIRASGATPSFKGYPGINPRRPFPASVCISIDDEIVHGIPGERTIRAGQIVSVDAGAIVDGWHGDGARTLYVGEPPAEIARLIDLTREAMLAGIAAAVPGNHIEDISAAVEAVAARAGLGVIRQFVGHGIGTEMHEEPQIPNYRTGRPGRKLEAGLCLAIEPMFTLGGYDTRIQPDDWTVVTADGSMAAHFEHSIAVTDHGPEILTVA